MTPKLKIFENSFAPVGRSRSKFPGRCRPLTCTCNEFGPDRLRFAGVFPEKLIFRTPKVITRLTAGFQAIKVCNATVQT